MSTHKSNVSKRWLVLLLTIDWMVLSYGKENGALVKRDTTLENVKAMYNRFVSDSTGKAKYADAGNNACSMDLPPSITKTPGIVHVAASKHDFQGSLGCGVCLNIVGSGKPAAADLDGSPPVEGSLKGIIVDQDDSLNQGDLAILPPQTGSGLWEISFKAADCPSAQGPTGYIQFRFTGSNDMYFKLQATNAKVPVAGIEAFERVKGKWFCLTRTTNNFFTNEGMGAVSFPLKVRLTSVMNEQLEATINALENDKVINSDVQFSDTAMRGGSPEGIKCYGQGDRPSTPEGDEGFCVSKEDGIYADPKDETAFYVCQGEKATKKFCPTGLKFNPVISSCDVPEDVKFVSAEAESGGSFDSKEGSRWISLPGDGSLKVFSVGESEKPTKQDDKVISKVSHPHKLFSINIFNGVQSHAIQQPPGGTQNKLASPVRYQGHLQDNVVNIMSVESAPLNGKAKKPVMVPETDVKSKSQEGLRNTTNQTIDHNNSVLLTQKLQPVIKGNMSQKIDQKDWRNDEGHMKNLRDSADNKSLANISENHLSPNDLGHFSTTPHKLFAINIYGSHPQLPSVHHETKTTTENRQDGEHTIEPVDEFRDTNSFADNGRKVLVDSSEFHIGKGEMLKNPGQLTTDINKNNSENANFGDKTDSFSTNDSISSMPLHFKLKIKMDNSGKQPVINCTLSECPENDFAIQEDRTNTSTSPVNGSKPEPIVSPQKLFVSQNNSKLGDFRVKFKTGQPESMNQKQEVKESRAPPMNLTKIIMPPSHMQDITNLSQQKNASKTPIQQLKSSSRQQNGDVPTLHHNDTVSLKTNKNAEQGQVKTDDNTKTMKISDNNKPDEMRGAEQKATTMDENAASNIQNSSNLKVSVGEKYETGNNVKDPVVTGGPVQEPGNAKASDKFREQKQIFTNNKFQANLQSGSVTKQLENANMKSPFLEQEQLSPHDFVQIQSRPQLKIILKTPGRILNPLNRRSGAKGHIVQILKSLIDRPLELDSKGKEVVSMLSSFTNKTVTGTARERISQDDSKAVEDGGNIAQSILEANKEYLDAIATQGMVFSDGDPETENMTSMDGSINHSHGYQQQEYEASRWKSPHTEGEDSSTEPQEHSLGINTHQGDSVQGEYLITRLQEDGGSGESVSEMGTNKDTGSGKPEHDEGSKGLPNRAGRVSVTDGLPGVSEMNAYKGGMRKPKVDSRLKSFCIGKSSGIYTNPFEQKSFVVCSNGVSEERQCPEAMLFNPKEKMCDVPDQRNTMRTKKRKETTKK